MNNQIFDLSQVKPNSFLKAVSKNGDVRYWVVKSCVDAGKRAETKSHLTEEVLKRIRRDGLKNLQIVEFNEVSTEWSMTLPTTTTGSFLSVANPAYEFDLFALTLDEVKSELLSNENNQISVVFKNATEEIEIIKKGHTGCIERTLSKVF